MDKLTKTINRVEQWADYWEKEYSPKFIAHLRALVATARAAQRAVEMLEAAEDVNVTYDEDGCIMVMVCAHLVDHAVAILKGECKE